MRTWPLFLPAASVLLPLAARADVLDVGGPAPDFAQIFSAVNAAADGDLIRVWPGGYEPFVVTDKSLSIVRATFDGVVLVNGTIVIQNLSPGRQVELTGISAIGTQGEGLRIHDCDGSVRAREGTFMGATSSGFSAQRWAGVWIERCSDVAVIYCAATGGPLPLGSSASLGGDGLRAIDSQVALFASTFVGTKGTSGQGTSEDGLRGGDGVRATGSGALFVSGCTLRGGDGGDAHVDCFFFCGWGGNGGWAHSGNAPAWLRGCTLEPGAGGWSPDASKMGQMGRSTGGGVLLPAPARILRTTWLQADTGVLDVRCEGVPGEVVWMTDSAAPSWQLADPDFGPLLVDLSPPPLATRWRLIGTIGTDGLLLTSLPVRDLPLLTHQTRHFQALFLGSGGGGVLSSPSWSMILDAAW